MTHVVAAAIAIPSGGQGYVVLDGAVWCACGRRFGMYDQEGLTNHIAKENSVGTEK